jgi:hypothetical protein
MSDSVFFSSVANDMHINGFEQAQKFWVMRSFLGTLAIALASSVLVICTHSSEDYFFRRMVELTANFKRIK